MTRLNASLADRDLRQDSPQLQGRQHAVGQGVEGVGILAHHQEPLLRPRVAMRPAGVVVPGVGARAGGEKTCPAVTVTQVRMIFTQLLHDPPPRPGEIARRVSAVLRRNEEARICAWHQRTGGYPPPRPLAETG